MGELPTKIYNEQNVYIIYTKQKWIMQPKKVPSQMKVQVIEPLYKLGFRRYKAKRLYNMTMFIKTFGFDCPNPI
ncbi:hypothetical protein JCM14469_06380 [Desulfatiferula olefinivorans]